MSSGLDSTEVFKACLKKLRLEGYEKKFVDAGWDTIGEFAFSVAFQPGAGATEEELEKVVYKVILKDVAEDILERDKARVRRLYWESYTMASAAMARKLAADGESEKPRPLPIEERTARLQAIKKKLGTRNVKEETQPADLLVDKFVTMAETGSIRYLPWEDLTKWDTEIRGVKKDPHWKTTPEGLFKFEEATTEKPADTGSDLKLLNALRRRGIAMEMANLLSYDSHEELVAWFIKELNRPPPRGYQNVSLQMLRDADEEVFVEMSLKVRDRGLPAAATDKLPLDEYLKVVLENPRIIALLNPKQGGQGKNNQPQGDATKGEKRNNAELERLRAENKKLRKGGCKGSYDNGGKGKGGGKAKGKGKKTSGGTMPYELQGMERVHQGVPICFSFNCASGCSNPLDPKGGCRKGKHVCARPGCGGPHSAQNCLNR